MVGREEWDQDYSHSVGHIGDGPVCIEQWRTRGRYIAGDNVRYGTELLSLGKNNSTFEGMLIQLLMPSLCNFKRIVRIGFLFYGHL